MNKMKKKFLLRVVAYSLFAIALSFAAALLLAKWGLSASLIWSISTGLIISIETGCFLCKDLQREIDYQTSKAEIYKELYDGSIKIFTRDYE